MAQSPSTHASLLERLSTTGDDADWQVFTQRYGALIQDYGRRRGLQPADCDDLLQDVLLSISKAMPGFTYDPERGRLRSYLKTVTVRAIHRKRGQKSEPASLEDVGEVSADDEAHWEQSWRRHHVRRALDRLGGEFPERTLRAFEVYVLEEKSAVETAEMLGVSVDVVYQSKSRVLRRVSEVIAAQVNEEG